MMLSGWTLFFVIVGAVSLTAQVFRIVSAIERASRPARRRAYAR